MLRSTTQTKVPDGSPLPKPLDHDALVEERLDLILACLQRMDKRDRLRMIGGFFRGLIAILPVVLVLGSAWYFYQHSAEIIKSLSQEAAKQAAVYSQQKSGDLMEQLKSYLH